VEVSLRFGLFDIMQVLEETTSQRAFAEHLNDAVLADEIGLDYYFVAERHFMPVYRSPSPSVWLGAVAARTKRIRIGALAYTLPMHNPVRLAEEVSMLDHLSGGRMEVGVGLGHRPEELRSIGVDPAYRQPLLLEGVVLLQRAWRGVPFDHPGQVYQFENLYVEAPVQRPFPPLWFAGNDPEALGWASRNGLSAAIGFQPNERLVVPANAFRTAERQEHAKKSAPEQHLALMRHLYVAESDERAMEEMTKDIMQIGGHFASSPRGIAAHPPKKMSRDEARASVEQMIKTDVIIGGGPETCASAIARAAQQLGIDVFLANPYLTGVEAKRVRRTLRFLSGAVRSRVNEMLGSADS
jgi:alkanesulfonate monooxygenase SsuD/methylene tetrahydromethanopterin reductase-like flavin-dependent oxidoreductase (luciferase family)